MDEEGPGSGKVYDVGVDYGHLGLVPVVVLVFGVLA